MHLSKPDISCCFLHLTKITGCTAFSCSAQLLWKNFLAIVKGWAQVRPVGETLVSICSEQHNAEAKKYLWLMYLGSNFH